MSSQSTPGVAPTHARSAPAQSADGATVTPVGVDVGSHRHLFAAATVADGLVGGITADADYLARLYAEFQSATHRLGTAPPSDPDNLGTLVARYWPLIRDALEAATDDVLAYAREHPAPVLVLEDLRAEPRPLVEIAYGEMRLASWCPAVAQAVLVDRAVEAGLPVATVDPEGTTQECHACGAVGDLEDGALVCRASDCPVDAVDRDRSAAVSIAKRGIR